MPEQPGAPTACGSCAGGPGEPLRNTFGWQPRVVAAGAVLGGLAVVVAAGATPGRWGAVALLALFFVAYAAPTWWKGRTSLQVTGDVLRVITPRGTTKVAGADVARVAYVHTGPSADLRLVRRDGSAVYCAVSRLDKGHSTVVEWLRQAAPQAVYDRRADDLRRHLVSRGLVGEDWPDS